MKLCGTFKVIEKLNNKSTVDFIQLTEVGDHLQFNLSIVNHNSYSRKQAVWVDVRNIRTGKYRQYSINELAGKFQEWFKLEQL